MTKRWFSLALALVLLATALTACGGAQTEEDSDTATTTTAEATTTTAAKPVYYVTATSLNVRRDPSTESDVLGQLPYGTAVDVLDTVEGWYRISYNGVPAYVSAQYVSLQAPSATTTTTTATTVATTIPAHSVVYVTANRLNVRSQPTVNSSILGELLYGETVEILGSADGWHTIEFGGATGYISADYVSLTAPADVSTAATTTTTTATTTAPTTTAAGGYPDATIPPLSGGLSEEERTELYEGLRDIISEKGSDYQSIYTYVNKNKTYRSMAEGESIEEMAYYTLTHKSASCYYFAAFTYLLMKEAGYEVSFVRGLGWQNGTEHCWIMFKEADGWYFMDSLYVRSAKLTTKECKEIGYKWNPTVHPEAK